MKYYSGKGDNGKTNIADKRVGKDNRIIEFIGSLDELSAFIGYAASKIKYEDIKLILKKIEKKIYIISAYAAGYAPLIKKERIEINKEDVADLERDIDLLAGEIKDITKFIYPNGSESACIINICRTIARKAERYAVKSDIKNEQILAYLNRLSSLLFVLSRTLNKRDGFNEEFF
ncbi:MAG: cob(I)yrinic acid a,c-diamide adenosyltransferase [Candidatus Parvarchaeota archaeon]|jgi:cob(I)alamin adenosyltransferase|nr:cob(I)yrinic acid a,c-diamide adenosyltransferase [Candidatus Parvarchaeota archaeon]MCL5107125.1 cob(I)yrinic acid a,c-diamide adenosyltransferase [Candidatus Parvarchaeota archaeon]